jgi:rare lipoprotein A
MFNVWIEDIQVIGLPAAIAPFEIHRSILPKVRVFARYASLFVMLLFAVHCTSPNASVAREMPPQTPPGDRPDDVEQEIAKVYLERGQASWYGGDGDGFAGGVTASGEVYDPSALTCAHRTLPFGTVVEVENMGNGKRTMLRVNDRGPFIRSRILDVSQRGAKELGLVHSGVANVRLRTVDAQGRPAPVDPALLQGNPYSIQVAALANPANIDRLSQELTAAFGPVTYQQAMGPGGITVKRIRVGSYPRMEMARMASQRLAQFCKDRGLDSFIIRQD